MRHIDDGALHAYLDGAHDLIGTPGGVEGLEAHLAECAACRARLEAEREVRDRTSAILGMGAPRATELPPFAALEGRRRAATPADAVAGAGIAAGDRDVDGDADDDVDRGAVRRRDPRRWRAVPMAWAATVVLALGAGWIAREVLETPGDDRLSVRSVEPESGSEGSPVIRRETEAVPPPVREPTGDAAEAAPESGFAAGAAGDPVDASPGAPAAPAGARESQALALVEESNVARERAEVRVARAGDDPRETVVPAAPPPAAVSDASDAMDPAGAPRTALRLRVDPEAETGERAREQAPVPLGEPAAVARYPIAAAPPPPMVPPPPPAAREQAAKFQEIIVAGAAASGEAWRTIDRATAEAALGRPVLSIPDLPIIAIEQPATGENGTVRVRQRLATGEVLTLQQTLAESPAVTRDAAAASRAPESERVRADAAARPLIAPSEVAARQEPDGAHVELREGPLVVHARAPISLAQLRELLTRLR